MKDKNKKSVLPFSKEQNCVILLSDEKKNADKTL